MTRPSCTCGRRSPSPGRSARARWRRGCWPVMGGASFAIDVDARPPAGWLEDSLRHLPRSRSSRGHRLGAQLSGRGAIHGRTYGGRGESSHRGARSRHQVGMAPGGRPVAAGACDRGGKTRAARRRGAAARGCCRRIRAGGRSLAGRTTLTMVAHLAFNRGADARALGPLCQALRLARDSGSGERMTMPSSWPHMFSTTAGVHVKWRRWWAPWRRSTCGSPRRNVPIRPLPARVASRRHPSGTGYRSRSARLAGAPRSSMSTESSDEVFPSSGPPTWPCGSWTRSWRLPPDQRAAAAKPQQKPACADGTSPTARRLPPRGRRLDRDLGGPHGPPARRARLRLPRRAAPPSRSRAACDRHRAARRGRRGR